MKVKEAIESLMQFDPELEYEYLDYDYNRNTEEFWEIDSHREYKGRVVLVLE